MRSLDSNPVLIAAFIVTIPSGVCCMRLALGSHTACHTNFVCVCVAYHTALRIISGRTVQQRRKLFLDAWLLHAYEIAD